MKTKKILYLFLLPLIFTACETKRYSGLHLGRCRSLFSTDCFPYGGSTTVTYSNSTGITLLPEQLPKKNSVTYSAEVRTMGNVTDLRPPFKDGKSIKK